MEEASTSDSDISMAFALRIQPHVDSEETCECAFQGLPTLMLMSLESFVPLPPKICYSAELRCEIFRRIGQSREKLLREFWRSFFQQWPHIQALHHCRLGPLCRCTGTAGWISVPVKTWVCAASNRIEAALGAIAQDSAYRVRIC